MNELVNTMLRILQEIIVTPGIPIRIGLMIAVATIIGYTLYDQLRNLISGWWKAAIAIVVYFFFQEWFRITVLDDIGTPRTMRPIVLVIIVATIYFIGITIGAYVSHGSGKRRQTTEKAITEVINKVVSERQGKGERPTIPHDLFKKIIIDEAPVRQR